MDDLPWIIYGDIMAHLPQARWVANETRGRADQRSNLRVYDGESALEAVLTGLGKSLLPASIGDKDSRLQRIDMKTGSSKMSRELWLLGHANQMNLRHIQAVITWADELFQPSQ